MRQLRWLFFCFLLTKGILTNFILVVILFRIIMNPFASQQMFMGVSNLYYSGVVIHHFYCIIPSFCMKQCLKALHEGFNRIGDFFVHLWKILGSLSIPWSIIASMFSNPCWCGYGNPRILYRVIMIHTSSHLLGETSSFQQRLCYKRRMLIK